MSFNFFKTTFGNIASLAKDMDKNIDVFCSQLIHNLEEYGITVPKDDNGRFKEEVILKSFDAFSNFKIKIRKSKQEDAVDLEKKRTTGFILFSSKKRDEIKETRPNVTFEEIGKIIGDAWKELPSKEKEKYNREAAVKNGVEYKEKVEKEKIILPYCAYDKCERKVKTNSVNGVYWCSEHKKKEAKMKEEKTELTEGTRPEKQEVKAKKEEVVEEEEVIPKSEIINHCEFKFNKEKPVPITNETFWKTNGIRGSKDRIHIATGLVLFAPSRDRVYLQGLNIDGTLYEKCDIPVCILKWVENCGINIDESELDE